VTPGPVRSSSSSHNLRQHSPGAMGHSCHPRRPIFGDITRRLYGRPRWWHVRRVLAACMLYHLPDIEVGFAELRRGMGTASCRAPAYRWWPWGSPLRSHVPGTLET
jgi:hypothetical protein